METKRSLPGWAKSILTGLRILSRVLLLLPIPVFMVWFSYTVDRSGLFQGDSCYTEIPGDLPKTTLVSIDGKLVYVHRANVDIIPASLFEE